jgi:hypothetical protein
VPFAGLGKGVSLVREHYEIALLSLNETNLLATDGSKFVPWKSGSVRTDGTEAGTNLCKPTANIEEIRKDLV